MCVVVIPAYQPDEQLIGLVDELSKNNFGIIVVNDGSGSEYDQIFAAAEKKAVVIRSYENEGKGAALKRGFAALKVNFPDCESFITADADGQHRAEDIIRVREKLKEGHSFVLTVRKAEGKVPARSKFGNDLSRIIYTVMNGHYFDDNQSGLRGFDICHLDWLLKVSGNKYDYEMNMLCFADKQGIKITPLPIKAIYIDGNNSSHFNPILDTVRIYKRLFSTTWASLFSAAIWEVSAFLLSLVFGYRFMWITVPTAVMGATLLTFLLNKLIAFKNVQYRDGLRMLLFALIRGTGYLVIANTVAFITTEIPLFAVLNFAALVMIVTEYLVHKKMHRVFK